MPHINCFAFVEDLPSAEVAIKLIEERNQGKTIAIQLSGGAPNITRGFGKIKANVQKYSAMAANNHHIFIITDLDQAPCAGELIRDWFSITPNGPIMLPDKLIFRVAVREIESWIMADREAFAQFIGIPVSNFSTDPDSLDDPKQTLINVLRRKGRNRMHREMIPRGSQHIGPMYNETLCNFISQQWTPSRAAQNSPSLQRAIDALDRI